MPNSTDNHGLDVDYSTGDSWDYNQEMNTIEERLIVRDVDANLGNYTPHDGAMFIATDNGAVYDGDGTSWNSADWAGGVGSSPLSGSRTQWVGGTAAADYDNLTDAIAAIPDDAHGGRIIVDDDYDYTNEASLPVTVDRPLKLIGSRMPEIDGSAETANPWLDVNIQNSSPEGFYMENFNITGFLNGILHRNTPYFIYRNVSVTSAEGIGFNFDDSSTQASFGGILENCEARVNGANGFEFDHFSYNALTLKNCVAYQNGSNGLRITQPMASVNIEGGFYQMSGNFNIRIDGARSLRIDGIYVESQNTNVSYEMVIADVEGGYMDTVYGYGGLSGSAAVMLRVNTGCDSFDIKNLVGLDYGSGNGMIDIASGPTDIDIYQASHVPLGTTGGVVHGDAGTRTRSYGTIRSQSLSGVTGQYPGDMGLDDGTNASVGPMLCVWTGSAWQPSDGGATFT